MTSLPNNDFLVEAIFDRLPTRSRTSGTGFTNINCPVCQERRGRCGVKPRFGGVGVYCFNCGFKASWNVGSGLFPEIRQFLTALGLTELQVASLAYKASSLRCEMLRSPELRAQVHYSGTPTFEAISLPLHSLSFQELDHIGCDDPDYLATKRYVEGRGKSIARKSVYHWSPDRANRINRRVIIPFEHRNQIVGWTARIIDPGVEPRYHSASQPNFLFNSYALSHREREIVILAEGVFDAIGLDCVGMLGARLNAAQIAWIKSSRKDVILLPDRDKRGLEMIDIALRERWRVAFPWNGWWDDCIKDAAEACRVYGQLYALKSVLETATDSPVRIAAQRLRLSQ